jgi:hypothetical protein
MNHNIIARTHTKARFARERPPELKAHRRRPIHPACSFFGTCDLRHTCAPVFHSFAQLHL